ncbi:MAG: hypothetical protein H6744_05640 [Deltaproteobacteria bacterium]|nr:hypothetical protein [Deltaproteobacteria bacterium]MCB9786162.1 hypothetical protein [Deltaproteobacteria bacterium]
MSTRGRALLIASLLAWASACAEPGGEGAADAPADATASVDSAFADTGSTLDAQADDTRAGDDTPARADSALDLPPTDDRDHDGIPDAADPFPDDATRPGVALELTVYAHTAAALFTMNVKTYQVAEVGEFDFPPTDALIEEMTDIAIDRWGVLWGISFERLWVCHPQTAECWLMGELPDRFNGLTWIPGPAISAGSDMLVGVSGDGGWFRLEPKGAAVAATKLGSYGPDLTSSGDAFSIEGIGTFASVNQGSEVDDRIVRVDPKTGGALALVGTTPGLYQLWGLAGWTERIFGFDASGEIVVVNVLSGEVASVAKTAHAWWGAGVRTRL